jgi:hypothetical protein
VIVERTHSEAAGKRTADARPRISDTQTEVSSTTSQSILIQVRVSNLRTQRLLALRKVLAFGEVVVHEARDIR